MMKLLSACVLVLSACDRGSAERTREVEPILDAEPTPEAEPVSEVEAPEQPADAQSRAHPGTIVFVDPEGREESRSVAEVPESIAWVEVAGDRLAVVRIESRSAADRLEIVRYGVDGRILDRTIGTGSPQPSR
jgi:hypothetical protein